MEVIVSAIASLGSAALNFGAASKEAKWGRLPDWLTAKDFQEDDYTIEIIFGAMALVFIILLAGSVYLAAKK